MKFSQAVMLSALIAQSQWGCSSTPPPPVATSPAVSVLTPIASPRAETASPSPLPVAPLSPTPLKTPEGRETPVAQHTPTPLPTETGHVVSQNNSVDTLECKGEDVTVKGNENRLFLKGAVGTLRIAGATNQVVVENADKIIITGQENQIQWTGHSPTIDNQGMENRVGPIPTPSP